MLYTNLKHLENSEEQERAIHENQYVIIVCGRMDHQCIAVFRMMEQLEATYAHVKFYDMEYDNPESQGIRSLSEDGNSSPIPFVVGYVNAKVVHIASAVQSKEEIIRMLDAEFTPPFSMSSNTIIR